MSLFTCRHYEWLSIFAKTNLSLSSRAALCRELAKSNPDFNTNKFKDASGITAFFLLKAKASLDKKG